MLAIFKNNTLYISGGLETFVDFGADGQQDYSTITSGISKTPLALSRCWETDKILFRS